MNTIYGGENLKLIAMAEMYAAVYSLLCTELLRTQLYHILLFTIR